MLGRTAWGSAFRKAACDDAGVLEQPGRTIFPRTGNGYPWLSPAPHPEDRRMTADSPPTITEMESRSAK
jgi:hypothetical protein